MTRYPTNEEGIPTKGAKWTVAALKSIPKEWNGDMLSDGEGLRGEVRVNSDVIKINFKYQFRFNGKMYWHYCGSFPDIRLADIRNERDKAKKLVESGIDPRAEKKAKKIEAQAAVEEIIRADEQKRKRPSPSTIYIRYGLRTA